MSPLDNQISGVGPFSTTVSLDSSHDGPRAIIIHPPTNQDDCAGNLRKQFRATKTPQILANRALVWSSGYRRNVNQQLMRASP